MSFMALFTLLSGGVLSAQASINGGLSKRIGVLEATFFNFLSGAMFLLISVLFVGGGERLVGIFTAPWWQIAAVFTGICYVMLSIASVPKIGVMAMSICAIIGQSFGGMLIDNFGWFSGNVIAITPMRAASLFFMLLALFFIYRARRQEARALNDVQKLQSIKGDDILPQPLHIGSAD